MTAARTSLRLISLPTTGAHHRSTKRASYAGGIIAYAHNWHYLRRPYSHLRRNLAIDTIAWLPGAYRAALEQLRSWVSLWTNVCSRQGRPVWATWHGGDAASTPRLYSSLAYTLRTFLDTALKLRCSPNTSAGWTVKHRGRQDGRSYALYCVGACW